MLQKELCINSDNGKTLSRLFKEYFKTFPTILKVHFNSTLNHHNILSLLLQDRLKTVQKIILVNAKAPFKLLFDNLNTIQNTFDFKIN